MQTEQKQPIDREWKDYPMGTKAHASTGGHWTRTERGWKWCTGATFGRPGGDAYAVTLPHNEQAKGRAAHLEKRMTPKEYAYWLADKIPAYGDYAKEAALVLRRQVDEIERLREALRPLAECHLPPEGFEQHGVTAHFTTAQIIAAKNAMPPNALAQGPGGSSPGPAGATGCAAQREDAKP